MRALNLLLVGIVLLGFSLIVSAVSVNANDAGRLIITSMNGPAEITTDGGPYTFSVTVTGGTPPYYIGWDVNGKQIKGTDNNSITVSAAQLESNGDPKITPDVVVSVSDSEADLQWNDGHSATYIDTSNNNEIARDFRMEYIAHYDDKGNFANYWTIYKTPSQWPYPMPEVSPTPTPTPTITPTPEADSGARFSSLSGQVEVRPDYDSKAWTFAKMSTVLLVDDHVKTAEDSNAIIGFSDLSTFLLKPESEIVISTPPSKDSKIGLVVGNIWVNVKKMMNDGTMEVDMSQAVAGIKGTVFEAESNSTSSTVKGIIHNITVTSKATGQTVTIGPGQEVTATTAGLGPVTAFNITQEATNWGISPDHINDSLPTTQGNTWTTASTSPTSTSPTPAPFVGAESIGAIMLGAVFYMFNWGKRELK